MEKIEVAVRLRPLLSVQATLMLKNQSSSEREHTNGMRQPDCMSEPSSEVWRIESDQKTLRLMPQAHIDIMQAFSNHSLSRQSSVGKLTSSAARGGHQPPLPRHNG
jgi:hypothetical protein